MTKTEAAIVSAYTGFLIGSFSDMYEYVEKIMGRKVGTSELGSIEILDEIKEKSKEDFMNIEII